MDSSSLQDGRVSHASEQLSSRLQRVLHKNFYSTSPPRDLPNPPTNSACLIMFVSERMYFWTDEKRQSQLPVEFSNLSADYVTTTSCTKDYRTCILISLATCCMSLSQAPKHTQKNQTYVTSQLL